MSLSNKTILITGANGGLGHALAQYALSQNAAKVYCCARSVSKLASLKEAYPSVVLCELDITDKQQVKALAADIGPIDILINNAGVNSGKRVFDECNDDFAVNVEGTLNVCRELRHRIAPEGAIITVTSILALVNLPVMGLYCASKSALHSLTQAMRAELASYGIDVYEVLPGPIDTGMSEGQEMEKADPADIAAAIFEGYRSKTYEIYPDPFSNMIKNALAADPKAVENDFAHSVR